MIYHPLNSSTLHLQDKTSTLHICLGWTCTARIAHQINSSETFNIYAEASWSLLKVIFLILSLYLSLQLHHIVILWPFTVNTFLSFLTRVPKWSFIVNKKIKFKLVAAFFSSVPSRKRHKTFCALTFFPMEIQC